jgi:serine/threonine-protein kinase
MSIPEKIGRYEIRSELGRGGMATVYRGYDPRFDREVAIKVLPREMLHDPQFRSRFERELKVVAGLEHPSIVPVYDVGDEDGQPYFVMRYMPGGSLADEIKKGKFSLEDTARIINRIAQALTYAHKKGIIHRDLKPDNILFDSAGEPFISDFGIAKLPQSAGSLTGSGIIGTPAYMSPEQARGNAIDSRSDVYGLGVIVYQMLSGEQPYKADTPMGVAVKHITDPVPEILKVQPSLPAGVDTIIRSAMAKDREQRYPTPTDLARSLNDTAFARDAEPTITPAKRAIAPSSPRLRPAFAVLGGIVVLALAGFFALRNVRGPAESTNGIPTDPPAAATNAGTDSPFAPACAAGLIQPTPAAKIKNEACIRRLPYTVVTIPIGATFEVSDRSRFTCREEARNVGTISVSCTGERFGTFDLKICQPAQAPASPAGQCGPGTVFDAPNGCCAPEPADGAGCTVLTITLKGCTQE